MLIVKPEKNPDTIPFRLQVKWDTLLRIYLLATIISVYLYEIQNPPYRCVTLELVVWQ